MRKTGGRADRIEWGSYRYDCRNTGWYRSPPTTGIRNSVTWTRWMGAHGNVVIESGGTLTVTSRWTMNKSSSIIVKSGGHLIVKGSIMNANVKVLPGGKLTMDGGSVSLRERGECTILSGAELNFQKGEIKHE